MKKILVLVSLIFLVSNLAWSTEKDQSSNNKKIRIIRTVEKLGDFFLKKNTDGNLEGTIVIIDWDETLVENKVWVFPNDGSEAIEISHVFTNEYKREDRAVVTAVLEKVSEEDFGIYFKKFKTVEGIAAVTEELVNTPFFGRFEYGYQPLSDKWQPLIKQLRSNGAKVIVGSAKNLFTSHILTKFHHAIPLKGKLMKALGIIDEYDEESESEEQREAELKYTKEAYYHLSSESGSKIEALQSLMPDLAEKYDGVIQIDNSRMVLEGCAKTDLPNCEYTLIEFTQFIIIWRINFCSI